MKYFTIVKSVYVFHLSLAHAAVSSRGNVVVIREAPTSSSSESNFTDPHSPDDTDRTLQLTVAKLEQLNVISDQHSLEIVRNEPLSFDGGAQESGDEMPIVKKSGEIGPLENGSDRGIFSVSRVKKVELSEIPLDISTTGRAQSPVKSSLAQHGTGSEFLTFMCEKCSNLPDLPCSQL
jgi:hypothetical protein